MQKTAQGDGFQTFCKSLSNMRKIVNNVKLAQCGGWL